MFPLTSDMRTTNTILHRTVDLIFLLKILTYRERAHSHTYADGAGVVVIVIAVVDVVVVVVGRSRSGGHSSLSRSLIHSDTHSGKIYSEREGEGTCIFFTKSR